MSKNPFQNKKPVNDPFGSSKSRESPKTNLGSDNSKNPFKTPFNSNNSKTPAKTPFDSKKTQEPKEMPSTWQGKIFHNYITRKNKNKADELACAELILQHKAAGKLPGQNSTKSSSQAGSTPSASDSKPDAPDTNPKQKNPYFN